MFRSSQIIPASQVIRNFRAISRYLEAEQEPVLITRKNGWHLVLMNAEAFEDLIVCKLGADGVEVRSEQALDVL